MPRIFCLAPLQAQSPLDLPPSAARHVQVLRLQPGDDLVLFNGQGGQYRARVERMGRQDVAVQVLEFEDVERETHRAVHLAVGMPANERMDWLIEKASELGACGFQPLHTERAVLRLSGERATKKCAHWQSIAAAASEQCGRNRVAQVAEVAELSSWLSHPKSVGSLTPPPKHRLVLSLREDSLPLTHWIEAHPQGDVCLLSGPEGGLSAREEDAARAAGYVGISLGSRTLRAETAPLAALVALTL